MTKSRMVTRRRDVENVLERLNVVDLRLVRKKLQDPIEGKGWSPAKTGRVELLYRRFLALTFAYRELTIVPSRDIDDFWHQHILDTRAYADDTSRVFGEFLHHFPYLGMNGPDDKRRLNRAYDQTKQLYRRYWPQDALVSHSADCSNCASACSSTACSSCSNE
jgi:hypothetical protein